MKLHYLAICAITLALFAPQQSNADVLAFYTFSEGETFEDANENEKATSTSVFQQSAISPIVYDTRSGNATVNGGIARRTDIPDFNQHGFAPTDSTPGGLSGNDVYHEFGVKFNSGNWSLDSLQLKYWVNGSTAGNENYRATVYSDLVGFDPGDELQSFQYNRDESQAPDIQTVTIDRDFFRQNFPTFGPNDEVNFRIVFSDNVSDAVIVHRVDNVELRGFRVATAVPEPAAASLLLLVGGFVALRRRRN